MKDFDIGTEFNWDLSGQCRQAGLAPCAMLNAAGLPSFEANSKEFEALIRVKTAF